VITSDIAQARGLRPSPSASARPDPAYPADASSVYSSPEIHAYTVSRYEDSADPDLLHESHLVYRRETSPSWRLGPGPAGQILNSPRITQSVPDTAPVKSKELDALLIDIRKTEQENRKAIELLFRAVENLSHRMDLEKSRSVPEKTAAEQGK
jgi:hypothetical protein